jgi:hypothetical protein
LKINSPSGIAAGYNWRGLEKPQGLVEIKMENALLVSLLLLKKFYWQPK